MRLTTSVLAGLGLIAAAGLVVPVQAASTDHSSAPTADTAQPNMMSPPGTAGMNNAPDNNAQASNADVNAPRGQAANMSPQTVKALQQALNGQGEKVSNDGVWGPETVSALKHFQQLNGLSVTGQLDQPTRVKLNLQG